MVNLGPRVGGAHVNVDLKFNERSVAQVGRKIHQQLKNLADSNVFKRINDQLVQVGETNRRVYRSIGKDGVTVWRSFLGVITSGAPLAGSAISGVTGAATMLLSALRETVIASGGLIGVAGSLGFAMTTLGFGFDHVIEAINEINPKKLEQQLDAMTPPAREFTLAMRDLLGVLQAEVQPRMFAGLLDEMEKLRSNFIPVLTQGFLDMTDALNGLIKELTAYAGSEEGLATIKETLDGSVTIFEHLSRAALPFLDGFLKLHNALVPASTRLADRIADVARNFQEWASAPGFAQRVDDRMKQAEKTAGLLFEVIGNLYKAFSNMFDAINPSTNSFLEMLVEVTQRFEDWTASVEGQNSIVQWANDAIDTMRQFGRTVEEIFGVIETLADPRVIQSFLKTVEGAFEYLSKLPLESMVNGFVKIAEALQPVSSLFLAIIISGAALNILLGALIGQLGGVFSVVNKLVTFRIVVGLFNKTGKSASESAAKVGFFSRVWQSLLRIWERVRAAFSKVIGLFRKTDSAIAPATQNATRFSKAFGSVINIFSRLAKFAGPAGIAIWIGQLVAKSEDLQAKLGELWNSVKDFGQAFVDAFNEIAAAFEPLMPAMEEVGNAVGSVLGPALSWIFDLLDSAAVVILGNALTSLSHIFSGLAEVIRGVGSVVAGFIEILTGLATWDYDAILDGFQNLGEGVLEIFTGLGEAILAPVLAAFETAGELAGEGFINGLKSIGEAIAGIGRWIIDAFKAVLGIASPSTVFMEIGTWAIQGFIQGIRSMIGAVVGVIRTLVTRVVTFLLRLPSRMVNLGVQTVTRLAGAIVRNTPKVLQAAGRIVSGVIDFIARLPGRLFTLGTQAITKMASAVGKGVSRLGGIAKQIFDRIVNFISKLPDRLFTVGANAVSRFATVMSTGVSRLGQIATNIKNSILNVIENIPGEMFDIGANIVSRLAKGLSSAIGKIKDVGGKIAGTLKGFLPGSPVEEGPLRAWNRGSDATGGGENVINAIAEGLRDTGAIRKAMADVSDAVATAFSGTSLRPATPGTATTPATATSPVSPNVKIEQNYYGPTTGRDRMRELDWTLRYATRAKEAI